ncbi:MAG: site-specific DNA-methyltransferase [Clostridia bacterium]|nr:site-specific DNA-methyltransferase [Clostridia bacterium]
MTAREQVHITPAKGRPMLTWVGKRPLSHVTVFPAQHVETFDPVESGGEQAENETWEDWPERYPQGGLLFHGDNKEVLAHMLANGFRGKVKLIYIDPPFDSGADYVRRVRLRGATGTAQIDGEDYSLGEQIQYEDIWANDNYLQFMYERLLLLKELLAEDGSIYVHMDSHRGHQIKLVLDEVFGPASFQREIIWRIGWVSGYKTAALNWIRNHDTIFFYTKDPARFTFNKIYIPYPEGYTRRDGSKPAGRGIPLEDTWNCSEADRLDSIQIMSFSGEKIDFPTQKNENLVARIISASSNPGDIVLDCFIGSGTTAAVAQKLGRRWIGCDINKGAIQTTSKRLQTVIKEQIAGDASGINGSSENDAPQPAQLSFTVWKVNDYDLQIQHNEAIDLVCEHMGVQQVRTDSFFDGVMGRNLVKIIPFNHPLSPLDLEEIRRELDARPDEDRNITVVCLGKELAADAWVEEWNRMRRGANAANRIDIIELRTDPKYGKFIEHKPASAKVKIARNNDELYVEIEDFVSPTIVERLTRQAGILRPQIEDWRSMVDCVMIDPAYNGEDFKIALSDIPERKEDLVKGRYILPAPEHSPTIVAVKIIDMLGEEMLVTEEV